MQVVCRFVFLRCKGILSLGSYSEIKVTGDKGILSIATEDIKDDGTSSIINLDPGFTQLLLKDKNIDLNRDNPFRREMDLYDKKVLDKVTKGLPEEEKQKFQDVANALTRASAHLSPDESNYEEIVKSEARGNSDELASYREKLLSESIYYITPSGAIEGKAFGYSSSDKEYDDFRRENPIKAELLSLLNPIELFNPLGKGEKAVKFASTAGKQIGKVSNSIGKRFSDLFKENSDVTLSSVNKKFRPLETLKNKEREIQEGGKYRHVKETRNVGEGKPCSRAHRDRIFSENMRVNGGKLIADDTGEILNFPKRLRKGEKADMQQAELDHKYPKSRGGRNSNQNAQVISKRSNLEKGNKTVREYELKKREEILRKLDRENNSNSSSGKNSSSSSSKGSSSKSSSSSNSKSSSGKSSSSSNSKSSSGKSSSSSSSKGSSGKSSSSSSSKGSSGKSSNRSSSKSSGNKR